MPKITFIDIEGTARTVEGEIGATVMETAIKHGVPGIEAECGGACACATCHVHVDEAWRAATAAERAEALPAETFDATRRARFRDVESSLGEAKAYILSLLKDR